MSWVQGPTTISQGADAGLMRRYEEAKVWLWLDLDLLDERLPVVPDDAITGCLLLYRILQLKR